MTAREEITVQPTTAKHRAAWDRLYAGYAAFYQVEQTPEMRERVWGWLMDPEHEVEGLVALNGEGSVVGLTHFRPYARPQAASVGCFLDDLFVTPEARGSGAAQALIGAVEAIARERGWSLVRWITAEDNARARKVYDRLASQTNWVTYDIKLT